MGLKQELRQKAYLLAEKCSRNIIYSMLIKNKNGEVFGALSNNILNIKFRSYTTGEIKLVRFELKNGKDSDGNSYTIASSNDLKLLSENEN